MSPRPAPSRQDETARLFLDAGARLIDASLGSPRHKLDHARSSSPVEFPAALAWLHIDQVIALARRHNPGRVSRGAFFRRWPERDQFLRDAVVYALLYRDGKPDPSDEATRLSGSVGEPLSIKVAELADEVLDYLVNHPRSFLLLHIGPMLTQHEELWRTVLPEMRATIEKWATGYAAIQQELGVHLRPGWTPQRYALALQAMVDGFLLRYLIQPDDYREARWRSAGLFADTVIAFTVGVLDTGDGRSTHGLLDDITRRPG